MRKQTTTYCIRGKIRLEKDVTGREKLNLKAHARIGRRTLVSAPVDVKGKFELEFQRKGMMRPPTLSLIVAPTLPENLFTPINTKKLSISPEEWKESGEVLLLEKEIVVEEAIIICWLPREVKVCGVVCKELPIEGTDLTRCCPVPLAKVEVFDIDSLILKPYKPTIKPIGELKEIPKAIITPPKKVVSEKTPFSVETSKVTVGEMKIRGVYEYPPFYIMDKLGEAFTDECGEFCLTFTWPGGCSPGDISPDLLFKVSQTLFAPTHPDANADGLVTFTIYTEGYSETRWDVPDYLWVKLDAAEGVLTTCNPDCHPLLDRRAMFVGVGAQKIYDDIEQGDDLSQACGFVYNHPFVKSPFGATLDIRGEFGSKVEDLGERWYRISFAKIPDCDSKPADDDVGAWTPITDSLTDTRYYWDPGEGSIHYEDVALGPQSLPGHGNPEFYQIRNAQDDAGYDLYWFDHNLVAKWQTNEWLSGKWVGKIDDGLYVLKIEVFDADGNPDPAVHIGDDVGRHAYMYLYINNKLPQVAIKEIYNGDTLINMDCGAFDHATGEEVKFLIDAYHEDDHLRYWKMTYQIGYGAAKGTVDKKSDGTVWSVDPIMEDFHGKENEFVIWDHFDEDFGFVEPEEGYITIPPAGDCSTFGVSIELAASTKITNGYDFLAARYSHYQEAHAGLAVHHSTE